MSKVTADEFAKKWGNRLKGSTAEISAGVDKVTEAPTEAAAKQSDKWLLRVSSEETRKKFERGLRRVSLEDWKGAMKNKGIGRISAGVDGATNKVREFAEQLLPHVDAGREKIKGMPSLTLDDSINRMAEFTRHMATFKKK